MLKISSGTIYGVDYIANHLFIATKKLENINAAVTELLILGVQHIETQYVNVIDQWNYVYAENTSITKWQCFNLLRKTCLLNACYLTIEIV